MADPNTKPHGVPAPTDRGHPLPRRTTPEKSVTLRHHRLARDATSREPARMGDAAPTSSPRRNSSGDSHMTGHSDPKKWFDASNRNPIASYDANNMDVDPPFFQKESDSSNEDIRLEMSGGPGGNYPYSGGLPVPLSRPTVTHSSSADDYRSVIDDLTVENKRLKEELKRYRMFSPNHLKKEKLFEIKFHGLHGRKKRELEDTLRKFAASLEEASDTPSQRKNSKHGKMHSYGDSTSKHASSSSSQSRPVDSAYASMSTGTGANSSGTSLPRPSKGSRARSSEQKVEHYLRDVPEGLIPGSSRDLLTDKDKKKLVVKKLEQLFTGKITGRNIHRNQPVPSTDAQSVPMLCFAPGLEASREAQIQPNDGGGKNAMSRSGVSTSNSNGDQTESRGNGNGSRSCGGGGVGSGGGTGTGNGQNTSPPSPTPPEQRPTRPRDLDPDRVQIPAENMEYIRHLGLVPPELLAEGGARDSLSPDADGWVYVNLLSNLAQLHIYNVSPDFIRRAISEKSTKFQLAPNGRKIRWRGGTEGTKFSSDSSGENSNGSPSTDDDDDDGSDKNGQRKRQKTGASASGPGVSATSSKNKSNLCPQPSASSESFHYKPLFVHQSSSMETSLEESGSLDSYQVEDSNVGDSRWGISGSGSPQRRKRRADGAVVFYHGAPFCADLCGDVGNLSPTTYETSSGREQASEETEALRPGVQRSFSGASIPFRPLTDKALFAADMELDGANTPELTTDDGGDESDLDSEFPWCEEPQKVYLRNNMPALDVSGLGGVSPADHFAVIVVTRRICHQNERPRDAESQTSDLIAGRLATMSTSSPHPPSCARTSAPPLEIEYVAARLRTMQPNPLPAPATFFPPFTETSYSDDEGCSRSDDEEDDAEDILTTSAGEILSKEANPHLSDNTYPEGEDLTSGDEEDEVGSDESDSPAGVMAGVPHLSRSIGRGLGKKKTKLVRTGSSVATAGGAESGYNSSIENV